MDIRKIIREELQRVLSEYEIFDYKKIFEEGDFIEYAFNTDGLVMKTQMIGE